MTRFLIYRLRFWELASDLTLALSGWVARRYAKAVEEQGREMAGGMGDG